MYICREILDDPSFPKIGEAFGGRDHTTVLHNVRKIASGIEADPELAKVVKEIMANIKKG